MFCTNCDKEDKKLDIRDPICKSCGFDNSYVLRLIEEDDEDEVEDELRDAKSCAQRVAILLGIVSAGHGDDRSEIVDWLKKEKLWKFVSAQEKEFLQETSSSEQQLINATWRAEALCLLLWSLNMLEEVPLTETCSFETIKSNCDFYLKDSKGFVNKAKLRDEDEIDDFNDLIYDSHWKVRDAQINGKPIPDKLNSSVVMERHYAINWLTGYCGQEWDDVSTDT